MLDDINLKRIVFLDIETVPEKSGFDELSAKKQQLWEKKSEYFRNVDETAKDVYQRAGIYAEFGKIICISVAVIKGKKDEYGLKIKSFYGDNEKDILTKFSDFLINLEKKWEIFLCAHNGKEFDFPYIARRLLINELPLPYSLDNAGRRPWEIKHLDTLALWKFGDYKHYTSLELLSSIFGIPSPKDDIDGSMIADVYYNNKDLRRIVDYCQNDVIAVVQLLLRFKNLPLIDESNIVFVE